MSGTPKKYQILRAVENSSRVYVQMPIKPLQVWTLLNEQRFLERGLVHHDTAFIEDSIHDWDWNKGRFRFYGHSGAPGEKHDLVLVFEK